MQQYFEEGCGTSKPLQMSNKKRKEKSNDQKPGSSLQVQFSENEEKKNVLFSNHTYVDEYNNSATSEISPQEDDHHDDLITNQEVNISVLKKYINAPLREVSPRALFIKPCNQHQASTEHKGAFSTASSKSMFEILRSSLTSGDVNLNLIIATYLRKLKAVKRAIHSGADVNTSLEMQTPLMIATETGDTRLVAYLLTVPGINLNAQNNFGHTPLIVAVGNGFDSIVRLLIKHKADINLPDHMGKTPLHSALFQQRANLVKLLLAFGANYEKSDCFGEKPMYTAAVKKPNLECLKALLKIGALPDYYTVSGISLLSRTILNGTDFKIIEALVAYGASVNSQDRVSKKTPLHFAAFMDNIRVAEFLVNEGADTNLKTTYNCTPLDEATIQKSLEVKIYLTELQRKSLSESRLDFMTL